MTFTSVMDDNDELLMLYDGPTTILEGRDIASVAKYMKSPQCKQVFVILGAGELVVPIRFMRLDINSTLMMFEGVSTAAGIPDFRSPRTSKLCPSSMY